MLNITWRDRKTTQWVREKNKVRDIMETISKLKWNWAGHVARRTDQGWTTRILFWTPRGRTRNRGRPTTRWRDDLDSSVKHWHHVNGEGLCPTTDIQRLKLMSNPITVYSRTSIIRTSLESPQQTVVWGEFGQLHSTLWVRSPAERQSDEKLVYRLIELFSSTEIFSKRRKIYAC